jgi:hypothetical protein
MYMLIRFVLEGAGLSQELAQAILSGLFEVTLGAKAAGTASAAIALSSKVAIAAFVLSWAGLSVHAQIVSLLSHTNLRYFPFLVARFLHALLSAAIVLVIWEPMQRFRGQIPVFLQQYDASSPLSSSLKLIFPMSALMMVFSLGVILVLFAAYSLLKSMYEKAGGT